MEGITILPIVIPPVVLIVGLLQIAPAPQGHALPLGLIYVVLAMPFAYRSLDAGLRAFDLKTLAEASNSLGGRWGSHAVADRAAQPDHRDAVGHRADRGAGAG